MTATAHRATYWLCAKKHCWLSAVVQVSFEHRTTILVATSLQAPSCGSSMTANVAGLLLFTCFFCAQPFIAHRLAAKQAVQVCCKASSTGLLQSKQYRFAAKQAVQVCCKASSAGLLQSKQYRFAAKQLSLLQSHQTISSKASKGLLLKIGISVWGSVWRMICTMWAITRHISGELTLPLLGSGVQSFVTHFVGTHTYGVCKFDIECLGSSTAGSLKFWLQPLPWMEQGRSQRMSLRQMNNFGRELFNIQRKRPNDGFCRQSLTILLCPVQKLKV